MFLGDNGKNHWWVYVEMSNLFVIYTKLCVNYFFSYERITLSKIFSYIKTFKSLTLLYYLGILFLTSEYEYKFFLSRVHFKITHFWLELKLMKIISSILRERQLVIGSQYNNILRVCLALFYPNIIEIF